VNYVTLYPDVPAHIRVTDWLINRDWTGTTPPRDESRLPAGWTQEDIDRVGELLGTMSIPDIAKEMGVSKYRIQGVVRKVFPDTVHYTKGKTWRTKWAPGDLQYILDNYVDCKLTSQPRLAEMFNVTHAKIKKTIYNLRREAE